MPRPVPQPSMPCFEQTVCQWINQLWQEQCLSPLLYRLHCLSEWKGDTCFYISIFAKLNPSRWQKLVPQVTMATTVAQRWLHSRGQGEIPTMVHSTLMQSKLCAKFFGAESYKPFTEVKLIFRLAWQSVTFAPGQAEKDARRNCTRNNLMIISK